MNKIKVVASELIIDESIYPRRGYSSSHVSVLADALKTGSVLPPIVIDQKRRIVDGVHRTKANQRLHGPDVELSAIQNTYESEADVLLAATELNQGHGLRLESFECTEVAIRLQNLRVPASRIAVAFHVPTEKIERILLVKTAIAPEPEPKVIALKRSMRPLAGQQLTTLEQEANQSAPGTSWPVHIDQLNKALRAGLGVKWGLDAKEHLQLTRSLLNEIRVDLEALVATA